MAVTAPLRVRDRFYIGGEWVEPSSAETLDVVNPATEEVAGRIPLRFGAMRLFTAHQMGSCRMGADPQDSVADPDGELHDTPGVWVGDASAFPTASGTNPMISIMALAHRTAEAIAADAGASEASAPAEAAQPA